MPEFHLKGKEIEMENIDEIGNPCLLLPVNDSKILILDYYHKTHLSLVDIKKKKHIKHLCNKGAGPQEVNHPTNIWFTNDVLGIYDANSQSVKTYYFEGDSILFKDSFPVGNTKYSIYNVHGVNDSIYICSGAFFPNRYLVYNSHKKSFSSFGKYPYQGELKIPKMSFGLVFQSEFLCLQNNYIVSSTFLSPSIAFYDLNKGDIRLLKEWKYEKPQVIAHNQDGMSWVDKKSSNKMGFCSLAANKANIFALYSGRTYDDKGDKMYYGNIIMVYSKEGDFIAKLTIDKDLSNICIMGDKIIGIINDPEIKLFSFFIPDNLKS